MIQICVWALRKWSVTLGCCTLIVCNRWKEKRYLSLRWRTGFLCLRREWWRIEADNTSKWNRIAGRPVPPKNLSWVSLTRAVSCGTLDSPWEKLPWMLLKVMLGRTNRTNCRTRIEVRMVQRELKLWGGGKKVMPRVLQTGYKRWSASSTTSDSSTKYMKRWVASNWMDWSQSKGHIAC